MFSIFFYSVLSHAQKVHNNLLQYTISANTVHMCMQSSFIAQTEGTIRLLREGVASQAYASGRVQVRLDSQWGNVCGDKTTSPFTLDEGDVACRQLGYTGSSGVTIATEDRLVAIIY